MNKGKMLCPVGICQEMKTVYERKMFQIDPERVEKPKFYRFYEFFSFSCNFGTRSERFHVLAVSND